MVQTTVQIALFVSFSTYLILLVTSTKQPQVSMKGDSLLDATDSRLGSEPHRSPFLQMIKKGIWVGNGYYHCKQPYPYPYPVAVPLPLPPPLPPQPPQPTIAPATAPPTTPVPTTAPTTPPRPPTRPPIPQPPPPYYYP